MPEHVRDLLADAMRSMFLCGFFFAAGTVSPGWGWWAVVWLGFAVASFCSGIASFRKALRAPAPDGIGEVGK